MTPTTTRLVLLALGFTLIGPPPLAQAQRLQLPLAGESPTTGVRLAAPSLVSSVQSAALEVNPALLAHLPSWHVLFHHAEIRQEGRQNGGGDALFGATTLPFYRPLGVGLGLQWLRPADAIGYDDSVKLSLGLAWRAGSLFSLGLAYHHYFCNGDDDLDGLDTLDLGLAVHPFEWLGAGLQVRDVTTPKWGGLPLQRVYELEVLVRPLRTQRLELSAGLRLGERRLEVDPRVRLAGEPIAGLTLFTEVELMHRDLYRTDDPVLDVRATAGVGVSWEHVSLALSTFLGRQLPETASGPLSEGGTRSAFQGLGATVALHGAAHEPLFSLEKKLLFVDMAEVKDSQDLARLAQLLLDLEGREDLAGLALKVDELKLGWSGVQEVRGFLARMRKAGKRSFAFVVAGGAREYYLAAGADRVYLDPAGGLRLQGLVMENLYFRNFLDKVGAKAQFIRIAEYKSAPEQFSRTEASPEGREARRALLDDLIGQVLSDLGRDRKKSPEAMKAIIDEGPFTPPLALAKGLVDDLVDPGEVEDRLKQETGAELVKAESLKRHTGRFQVGGGVAIIVVEGDIVQGKSQTIPLIGSRTAGDRTLVEAIEWARGADEVRAVVLRVNSPGGSALASHHIWQELRKLQKVKPVVVSLGDVAASGGYYVASGGGRILAQPATITGSIGIFTGKFDLSGLMRHLGITEDGEARGLRARMDSFTRPYSDEERAVILDRLQYYYRQFLGAVAVSRGMTQDRVHGLARGRIWSGQQAIKRGLCDGTGGLIEALEEARRLAGFSSSAPVRTFLLPRQPKGLLQRVLGLAGLDRSSILPLPASLGDLLRVVPPVLFSASSGEPLARLPYQIDIN